MPLPFPVFPAGRGDRPCSPLCFAGAGRGSRPCRLLAIWEGRGISPLSALLFCRARRGLVTPCGLRGFCQGRGSRPLLHPCWSLQARAEAPCHPPSRALSLSLSGRGWGPCHSLLLSGRGQGPCQYHVLSGKGLPRPLPFIYSVGVGARYPCPVIMSVWQGPKPLPFHELARRDSVSLPLVTLRWGRGSRPCRLSCFVR